MGKNHDIFGVSKEDRSYGIHKDIFGTYGDEVESEGGLMRFIRSTAYTAVQKPIEGVAQLVDHTFGADWHPEPFIHAPQKDDFWTKAGSFAGTLADYAIVSRATGGALSKMGLTGPGAPMAAGFLSGVTYSALMPVADNENYWSLKGRNALVLGGTFATMAGASQIIGAGGWLGQAGKRTLLQDVAVGGLSGAPGGFANAELSSLLDGKGWASPSEVASQTLTYGAFGAAMGGINHGMDFAMEKAKMAMAESYVDGSGRLIKLTDPYNKPAYLKYDDSGQLIEFRLQSGNGVEEIFRATRTPDGHVSWTGGIQSGGQIITPQEPWSGTIQMDADGKGVMFNGASSTMHMRAGEAATVTQTPDQIAHQAKVKPAWDKLWKSMDPDGASAALPGAAALPMMIPRF